jgi:hypothetical protein
MNFCRQTGDAVCLAGGGSYLARQDGKMQEIFSFLIKAVDDSYIRRVNSSLACLPITQQIMMDSLNRLYSERSSCSTIKIKLPNLSPFSSPQGILSDYGVPDEVYVEQMPMSQM